MEIPWNFVSPEKWEPGGDPRVVREGGGANMVSTYAHDLHNL